MPLLPPPREGDAAPQHLVAGALTAADLLVEPVDHAASPAANNKQNYNAWCLISVRDEVVEYSNERCYSEILSSPLTGSIPNLCASIQKPNFLVSQEFRVRRPSCREVPQIFCALEKLLTLFELTLLRHLRIEARVVTCGHRAQVGANDAAVVFTHLVPTRNGVIGFLLHPWSYFYKL